MHIPDGLIPWWQWPIYFVIVIIVLFFALRWARNNLDERNVPLMAVLAAGVFAVQLFNFPIIGGTSGHVVGAVLVSILLGSPFAGFLVLTIVLVVQLTYGDGGLTALGANIVNMGIIASFTGYYTYKGVKSLLKEPIAIFIAGWLSALLASIAAAIELAAAGVFPLFSGVILMGGYYAIIGIGEGLITTIAVETIRGLRPNLVDSD